MTQRVKELSNGSARAPLFEDYMLTFTKQELIEIGKVLVSFYCDPKNPVDEQLMKKIEYQIEHIERQERTAAKFNEWQRQLKEQR